MTSPKSEPSTVSRSGHSIISLRNLQPILLMVGLLVFFGALAPAFFTPFNLESIGYIVPPTLLMGLGLTFAFMMGSIDISVVSVLAFASVSSALTLPYLGFGCMFVGVGVGLLAGFINGMIFVVGRIPSFITTLGTNITLTGIITLVSGGFDIPFDNQAVREVAVATTGGVPIMLWWSVLATVILTFIAFRTTFGRRTYSIGGNVIAARKSGIRIERHRILVMTLSGLMAGIAGFMFAANTGTANATQGSALLLPTIAAVAAGGTPITGGEGGPHRTFIGAMMLSILTNGMNVLRIDTNVQLIIFGILVILFITTTLERGKLTLVR